MNDQHEKSRAAFEAAFDHFTHERGEKEYRDEFEQRRWEAWCRALDYAAEQQIQKQCQSTKDHVREAAQFVDRRTCNSTVVMNPTIEPMDWIRAARVLRNEVMDLEERLAEMSEQQAKQPKPLTRPDRPGWWWGWAEADKEWACCHVTDPQWVGLGLWLPATPPPAPSQTNHQ